MLRRTLFKKLASGLIGVGLVLVPLGAGIVFLLDPLRRRSHQRFFKRVTSIDSLPLGTPRSFTVTGTRTDAWQTTFDVPIGAVYLVRGTDEVHAFQVMCPHAGCFVEYDPGQQHFICPCHESSFNLDGSIKNSDSPAARGLDRLEVKLEGTEVRVRYQEFRQGIGDQVAVS